MYIVTVMFIGRSLLLSYRKKPWNDESLRSLKSEAFDGELDFTANLWRLRITTSLNMFKRTYVIDQVIYVDIVDRIIYQNSFFY